MVSLEIDAFLKNSGEHLPSVRLLTWLILFYGGFFMFSYIWPIALVVVSNIVYHICSKSVPGDADPFACLTVTYAVGAALCAAIYFLTNRHAQLLRELQKLNWAPIVLGVVVVGLEVGFVYAYRAGWAVSRAFIVQSAFLAVALVVVGLTLYHESVSWNKLLGVGICLVGLVLVNL